MAIRGVLPLVLVAYAAASLFHHAHNAEFLDQYPNMPAWISPFHAYAAWLGTTLVGLAGYVLLRRGHHVAGLIMLSGYGCYGLGSLTHYALAPVTAHTLAMNLSIWFEAATAACLLATAWSNSRANTR